MGRGATTVRHFEREQMVALWNTGRYTVAQIAAVMQRDVSTCKRQLKNALGYWPNRENYERYKPPAHMTKGALLPNSSIVTQSLVRAQRSNDVAAALDEANNPPKTTWAQLDRDGKLGLVNYEFFVTQILQEDLYACQKEWVSYTEQHQFAAIWGPPRHGKSHEFSMRRVIWYLCGGGYTVDQYVAGQPLRDTQVLLAMKSEDQATKNSYAIAARLTDTHSKLVKTYGEFRDPSLPWKESKGAFTIAGRQTALLSGDYSLVVVGDKSAVLGRGAHRIIVDDFADLGNCPDAAAAEKLLNRLRTQILTRLEPGGTVTLLGAKLPIHGDPYTQIEDWPADLMVDTENDAPDEDAPKLFRVKIDSAVQDWEAQTLLCPERWTWKNLMATRSLVGESIFEAMYQQNPQGAGTTIATRSMIYGSSTYPGCLDGRSLGEPPELTTSDLDGSKKAIPSIRVLSIDPSPDNYAAAYIMDIPHFGKEVLTYEPYLLDLRRDKMSTGDYLELFKRWHDRYQYKILMIEENNAQYLVRNRDFTKFLLDHKVRLEKHLTTGRSKNDLAYGLQSLTGDFEAGRIHIPNGDNDARWAFQWLIKEALGEIRTDDTLMALWMPKWNLAKLLMAARIGHRGSSYPGPVTNATRIGKPRPIPARLLKQTRRVRSF